MSLLNAQQREIIRVDTGIDRLIIDRVVEAFDAAIQRGDRDAYIHLIKTAYAQQGIDLPIPEEEKPTAVDIVKTICIRAYADELHVPFKVAAQRMRDLLAAG